MERVLPFHNLSQRHTGLTEAIGSSYSEAARVCLDRHHTSPVTFLIEATTQKCDALPQWQSTDDRTRGAWANAIDATEAGAYGIALAAIEIAEGMVAVRRAETRTGADYYIGLVGANGEDLEAWFRLEVSGIDRGDNSLVQQRVGEKVRQALRGASNLPALATVVGFLAKHVVVARAEAP